MFSRLAEEHTSIVSTPSITLIYECVGIMMNHPSAKVIIKPTGYRGNYSALILSQFTMLYKVEEGLTENQEATNRHG